MLPNWRNRPTSIDNVPADIGRIIAIDESGTSSLKHALKSKRNGTESLKCERNFVISGCSIYCKDIRSIGEKIMELKYRYWKDGLYNYKGKDKRVCFHSKEIRGRNGAFKLDKNVYDQFEQDLRTTLKQLPIKLFVSHIDKMAHVKRYIDPLPPYNLCMTFILERIVRDLEKDETCIIILESRGKKEDENLLEFIADIIDNGTQYIKSDKFESVKGVYFNPKWSVSDNDTKSYWSLEIADLLVYPFYKFFNENAVNDDYKALLPKLCNYPNYLGSGLKSFP
ncbi:DUF3800 domain-containing protein [Anaerococcus tetradius]|uniref:DUF3800 domain-containing protein n=1 Tax=Anaerococcus tetradius TaxID=33036 RepID=UPI0023F1B2EB|nr:DUF3800 domain-containing protein [Anaerococcus tetradius]